MPTYRYACGENELESAATHSMTSGYAAVAAAIEFLGLAPLTTTGTRFRNLGPWIMT